jgi:hypothetical protein
MKKLIQSLSLLCILISCQKQVDIPQTVSTETSQTQTAADLRITYLPLTKGTYWKYNVVTGTVEEPSTVRVLGLEQRIRTKTYEKVKVKKDKEKDTIYYNQTIDKYYVYTNSSDNGETMDLELLFLYDDQPVGFQWQGTAGSANGMAARYTGKILQKDISLTLNGVIYRHVIHSQVQVQVRVLFYYVTASVEDFYVAQAIGIVKNVTVVKLGDPSVSTSTITEYRIN